MRTTGKTGLLFALLLATLTVVSPASAVPIDVGNLVFRLDLPYSGTATSPTGTSPWLQVKFENLSANVVRLTMDTFNLAANTSQWAFKWFFNFDDKLDLFNLKFTPQSTVVGNRLLSENGIPDGTGQLFDFAFLFKSSDFGPGKSSIWDLTFIDGAPIASSLFDFKSSPLGYFSAAVINGIGPGGNLISQIGAINSITPGPGPGPGPGQIPEPASLLLLTVGLAGIGFFGRKRLVN